MKSSLTADADSASPVLSVNIASTMRSTDPKAPNKAYLYRVVNVMLGTMQLNYKVRRPISLLLRTLILSLVDYPFPTNRLAPTVFYILRRRHRYHQATQRKHHQRHDSHQVQELSVVYHPRIGYHSMHAHESQL